MEYTNLPDIDENSQDVFETSDIESDVEVPSVPTPSEELDFMSARKRFEQSVIVDDMSNVDFLGKVSHGLGRSGYFVESVNETIAQKLARIARELEEIRLQESPDKDSLLEKDSKPDQGTLQQIGVLEKVLVSLKENSPHNFYGDRVDKALLDAHIEFSLVERVEPPKSATSVGEILALESRLYNVERLIGVEKEMLTLKASSGSLQTSLNDLKRRINIIHNPEYYIQRVKQDINKLGEETEKLEARRKLLEITSTGEGEQKEPLSLENDEIYTKLHEIDAINHVVPMLITRLKTLHLVHGDVANVVEVVSSLDETLDGIKADIVSWDTSINTLNSNLKEYETNFEINKGVITKRLDELERRYGNE